MTLPTKFLLVLFALAMMTGTAPTAACSQETITAATAAKRDVLSLYFKPQKFTPGNRVELSRRLAAHCREILDTVPTNTPAEEAWVAAETTTSDTNRVIRVVSSKEWARHQLKGVFSECLEKVALLQSAQADHAGSAEAAQFISLAYTFDESDDLLAFAKRVDLKSDLTGMNIYRKIFMIAAMRTLDGRDG